MSEPAHLLPPNATGAERTLSQAMARMADVPPHNRQMWNPTTCHAPHLPWLAWALSVDEWDAAWSEAQKRAVISASYFVHRHKGTVGAVKAALGALAWEARIVEWHHLSPPGPPYTFSVEITLDRRGIQPGIYDDVARLVAASKNLRSHLTGIRLVHRQAARLRLAGATVTLETVTVLPPQVGLLQSQAALHGAMALASHDITTLYPQAH